MSETLYSPTTQSKFELTTTLDDDQECATEGCHDEHDEQLSLILGCDMQGMLADFGTVAFCSLRCARRFDATGPMQSAESDTIIYTGRPVVATVAFEADESADDVRMIKKEAGEFVVWDGVETFDAHPTDDHDDHTEVALEVTLGHDAEAAIEAAASVVGDLVADHELPADRLTISTSGL